MGNIDYKRKKNILSASKWNSDHRDIFNARRRLRRLQKKNAMQIGINRTCNKCKNEYDLSKFKKHNKYKDGYGFICKFCHNASCREYNDRLNTEGKARKQKHKPRTPEEKIIRNIKLRDKYKNDSEYREKVLKNQKIVRSKCRNILLEKQKQYIAGLSKEQIKAMRDKQKLWKHKNNKAVLRNERMKNRIHAKNLTNTYIIRTQFKGIDRLSISQDMIDLQKNILKAKRMLNMVNKPRKFSWNEQK